MPGNRPYRPDGSSLWHHARSRSCLPFLGEQFPFPCRPSVDDAADPNPSPSISDSLRRVQQQAELIPVPARSRLSTGEVPPVARSWGRCSRTGWRVPVAAVSLHARPRPRRYRCRYEVRQARDDRFARLRGAAVPSQAAEFAGVFEWLRVGFPEPLRGRPGDSWGCGSGSSACSDSHFRWRLRSADSSGSLATSVSGLRIGGQSVDNVVDYSSILCRFKSLRNGFNDSSGL